VETAAVLSLDDDLIVSCEDLDFAHGVWQSSPQSLVGFTPRLVTRRGSSSSSSFLYHSSWKVVWWHGTYNMILTKCCFMHRDLLGAYFRVLSPEMLAWIEERRNCEDIAMQFVASNSSGGAPPVWVQARMSDYGTKAGISQGKDHVDERSHCVDRLVQDLGGHFPLTLTNHKAVNAKKAWLYP
jgi:hypothetical protein